MNLQMNEGHAHGKTVWCRIRDLNSYAGGSGTWIRRVCQFHQSCIFLISNQLILRLSSRSKRLVQCCHTLFDCGDFCLLAQPFFGVAQFLLFCFRAQICICTTLRLIWSHHAPCLPLLAKAILGSIGYSFFYEVVEIAGLEPATLCLQSRCSPNWAISPYFTA